MLVKSQTQEQFISDLREIFEVLRSSGMRLNPKKYTFGVRSGKFLGYMISKEGVRANPDKIKAILDMAPPRNIKEVQRLIGRMAALNRFLSRSAVRGSPFFKALKGAQKLRTYFQTHPVVVVTDQPLKEILSKPEASGRMVKWAVELSEYDLGYQPRTAIKAQALVDFIADGVSFGSTEAEAEQAEETNKGGKDEGIIKDAHPRRAAEALQAQKTTKAVLIREAVEVLAAEDAAGVAQASQVAEVEQVGEVVETEQVKEAVEASQVGKAAEVGLAGEAAETKKATKAEEQMDPPWTLYVDGASSKEGCGVGLLLISPTGEELPYALRFDFRTSNNESEYEALIAGMEIARKLGVRSIKVYSDSQLIVNQVWGSYEVKEGTLRKYVAKTRELKGLFEQFALEQIPRSQNKRADALSKLASTSVGILGREIVMEVVRSRAYEQVSAAVIHVVSSWMDPIVRYLAQGELPPSRIEARKILLKSQRYVLTHGVLYRKSYLQLWLKCVTPEEGGYVLRELHEGLCGNHVGPRVLAKKGMLAGYYWPTIFRDSAELVARCKSCQLHAPVHHAPTQEMILLHSPWPFFQWGIDLLGLFPRAPGGYEHLVVAIDYFTKWIEVEPLSTISSRSIHKFLWRNVVCRFDIPRVLVSDNGRQFADHSLQEWCAELGIQQHFTSVGHPQANGQVENVNRTILHGLRTRIESAQTVIPTEIGVPSGRVQHFVAQGNEEEMRFDLDMLEYRREEAAIRMAKYKGQIARYYNAMVRHLSFKSGDLVLRKNSVSRAVGTGKLDPNWEGPYVVKEANRADWAMTRTGGGRYSDPDELEEEELDESISIGAGRTILRLGAELVRSECVEEDDIKRKEDLLVDEGEELKYARKGDPTLERPHRMRSELVKIGEKEE
ncbi:uncharacterized protein [Coffea arabica]|uniref:Uncharacterized protein n=1 Tax=Coffea arabica TaxID=13443 RepID=A0A6P6V8E6_COFAR|nr:uncharacterized protein LOC113718486 [Coffea arabica]